MTVRPGVRVTIRDLTIRNGATPNSGGGISNRGTLVLRDVIVRGNTARTAGGVFNADCGTLTLNGASSIRGNTAGQVGGGVSNDGILGLRDSSRISQNSAGERGGGVYHDGLASLRMRGSTVITGNDAGLGGGGIYVHGGSLDGVRYQEPDTDPNNVWDNTPDDVLDVMLDAPSET